jgi:hypothetical protein
MEPQESLNEPEQTVSDSNDFDDIPTLPLATEFRHVSPDSPDSSEFRALLEAEARRRLRDGE